MKIAPSNQKNLKTVTIEIINYKVIKLQKDLELLRLVVSNLIDYVDFGKSSFYISNYLRKLDEINLSSKNEYLEMLNSFMKNTSEGYKTLQASEISLLPTFQDLSFDMFIISGFDRKKYISERLKEIYFREAQRNA